MNILGATKLWQAIVMFVLIAVLAVFNFLFITEATKTVYVSLGESHTFAQMMFGRLYVDHYGEPTVADAVIEERERLDEEYRFELAAYEAALAEHEALPRARRPEFTLEEPEEPRLSEEFIGELAAGLGTQELIATVELNLVEAVVFCAAIDILLLYAFYLFVLRKGKSAESEAPDHESHY